MCISKEEYKMLTEAHKELVKMIDELKDEMSKVKHDTGNIKTSQQGMNIAFKETNKHLKTLNSRTSKMEGKVENLEDPDIKEVRCIQKPTIEEIREGMRNVLTIEMFEAWQEREKEEKRQEEERAEKAELKAILLVDKRQKKTARNLSIIVSIGMMATALAALFL